MPDPGDSYVIDPGNARFVATTAEHVCELAVPVGAFGAMPVRFELDDDGTILATALFSGDYGVGLDFPSALHALAAAVERYYSFLREEGPDRLSPYLQAQLASLEARRLMRGVALAAGHGTLALAA